jgi:hypothetical protein
MKTRISLIIASIILVVGFISFYGCQKDNSTSVNGTVTATELTSASDNAAVNEISDNITQEAENTASTLDATGYPSTKSAETGQCSTITITHPNDSTIFPKVITIVYTSCSDSVGAAKTGTIIITITKRYWQSGSERSIQFIDFSVNGFSINGTKSVTNAGFVSGYLTWNVTDSITVKFPDNVTTIKRDWARLRVLQTPTTFDGTDASWLLFKRYWKNNWWHAMYKVTGNGTGTNRFGDALTMTTVSPLYFKRGCKHVLAGDLLLANTTRNRSVETNWGVDPTVKCGLNDVTVTITDSLNHIIVKHPGHLNW